MLCYRCGDTKWITVRCGHTGEPEKDICPECDTAAKVEYLEKLRAEETAAGPGEFPW